jgi:hypothetical protein
VNWFALNDGREPDAVTPRYVRSEAAVWFVRSPIAHAVGFTMTCAFNGKANR